MQECKYRIGLDGEIPQREIDRKLFSLRLGTSVDGSKKVHRLISELTCILSIYSYLRHPPLIGESLEMGDNWLFFMFNHE